ncbi:MAG: DEAD/DEAH box helicase family protein [Pyrinomonadaceae bacterium]|nr:DEAD/DEAH box helicase family protein [Pyrinomonadaceae bacterium]
MHPNQIENILSEKIVGKIENSRGGLIYRKYDTFLSWFGMEKRRNADLIDHLDDHLNKHKIRLWCGKEERKSANDFGRGETVTFRFDVGESPNNNMSKALNKHAGTIKISPASSRINLYNHQREAIRNLEDTIAKKSFSGMLVLPTGGGKTLTAAYWLAKNYLDRNKKILWIAHRHELLNQAKLAFREKLAFADVFKHKESINYRPVSGIHDRAVNIKKEDDIIFASKDSINSNLEHLGKNWLNDLNEVFLVIDEAHHATAKTYRRLIENLRGKCKNVNILGLTATPFRTAEDEQGLLKKVFPDDIVYKIDLRALIRLGILSEPIFEDVETKFDFAREIGDQQLEKLRTSHLDLDSLGRDTIKTISENRERNLAIVNRYVKNKEKYGQTLVFALNQDNAIALNRLFRDKGVKSDYVISAVKDEFLGVSRSDRENPEKIDRFKRGEIEVLINVNILTEGTDLPGVQSVFLARPTVSTILMTQMIGRGLRGVKAGGTAKTYIVSFIDNGQNNISWVNPEQLFIEENVDFDDQDENTRERFVRLISIKKIEEFAALANNTLDIETQKQLESLDFIERVPLGIYQFALSEPDVKNCEVLIYDNIRQSYQDFIDSLPHFFASHKLNDKDFLTPDELEDLGNIAETEFFRGCLKYPAYYLDDIKNVLQFYANTETVPPFIELKDREKFDLSAIAMEIAEKDFRNSEKNEYIDKKWNDGEKEWRAFFGYDKRYFLNEIDLAIRKLNNPEIFVCEHKIPIDDYELRELKKLSMFELREQFPEYHKKLRDEVFAKFKEKDGFYCSAERDYRSKSKYNFQIDHITPMKNGGLTEISNLQLLTRSENAKKGAN